MEALHCTSGQTNCLKLVLVIICGCFFLGGEGGEWEQSMVLSCIFFSFGCLLELCCNFCDSSGEKKFKSVKCAV